MTIKEEQNDARASGQKKVVGHGIIVNVSRSIKSHFVDSFQELTDSFITILHSNVAINL